MTEAEWKAAALALPGELAKVDRNDGDGGLAEAIFLVWRSLAFAPSPVKQLYSLIPESDILALAESCDVHLPNFGLAVSGALSDAELVGQLGGCLRALEQEFAALHLGSQRSNPNDWKVGNDAAHFIPMGRLGWRQPNRPEEDRRPFDQRGLLQVRLIPTVVDGATVRLVRPDGLASPSFKNFGAVLFPGATFKIDDKPTTFLVDAVELPNGNDIIAKACEAAHKEGCRATVFPELTIDLASRDFIKGQLKKKPWLKGEGVPRAPHFVVAGSWHEIDEDGRRYNVATVFDGHGDKVLTHRKRLIYKDHEGRAEDILHGSEFVILILGDALYAFGICLDFCHRCFDTPYGELDVDFVIVPSCGDVKTMKNHIQTATDLHHSRKTRTFVVQQAHPEIPPAAGFVLKPDGNPGNRTANQLKVAKSWTIYRP